MFDLSLEVLKVVEQAAIASARTMGMGDADGADHDRALERDSIEVAAHAFDRRLVGAVRVTHPHRARRRDRRLLHYLQHFQ